jgi:hypothetical protein
MNRMLSAFTLAALVNWGAGAQPLAAPYDANPEIAQWEVIDLTFQAAELPQGSPFDAIFGAVFSGPDNARLHLPGVFNDGKEWIIRFSAAQAGKWTFQTYSSHRELSGLRGALSVRANTRPDRHGKVLVDAHSPQRFTYEDGTPYFALAFELDWLFALDFGNREGLPKTRQIVADLKANGFNQIVMNVYAYDVKWRTDQPPARYQYGKPDCFPFLGSNDKPDFSSLNVDFFKHFDRVIQYLDEQGIVAHIMIYVWNKNVNWPGMYTWADNLYFDYIIDRYQAFSNVIWDVSKEALDYGRCDIPYVNERISRIRKRDAYGRLLTVHDYEYCSREPDRVDFISIQSWRSHLYSLMLEAREKHADKPVMNIEHGGYEEGPYRSFTGNFVNPEICLIRNYECVFAGVYSTYYWQNTSWNIVVYDPFAEGHDFSPPRFDYYRHLRTLFDRYDFNRLFAPRSKITTNNRVGLDNLATGGYPLTNGEDLYLFLIPDYHHEISAVLPKPKSGFFNVVWFHPFTGEFLEKGEVSWSGWMGFQSPWPNAYSVLILEAKR